MIPKFVLLMGLIPVLGSFLARKFLCNRIVRAEGDVEVSLTGEELVKRILERAKVSGVEVVVKKRTFLKLGREHLLLPPALASSRKAGAVAEAGILAGMVLMARQQEKVAAWRTWALKFGWAFPVFTTVVAIFAMAIGRSPTIFLSTIAGSLGLTTLLLWFTLPVERGAAKVVAEMLEGTALVNRRSEGEKLARLVRALGWKRIVPGAISWMAEK